MRRLCERPGCAALAEVSYGIDNSSLTVWLDNTHIPEREYAGRLCRRHANALVVPRGWTVDDRRQAIPQLFRNLERDEARDMQGEKKAQPRRRRKPAETSTAQLSAAPSPEEPSLFEGVARLDQTARTTTETATHEAKEIVLDPDETRALSWSPATVHKEDDHDSDEPEPVFGRLMGRAFRQKGQP